MNYTMYWQIFLLKNAPGLSKTPILHLITVMINSETHTLMLTLSDENMKSPRRPGVRDPVREQH